MCQRRRSQWHRAGVIFVHIPKAAGTSIADALYGRSMGHMTAVEIRLFCPRLFARCATFAVSRNPWDRLVSAYEFVKQGGTREAAVWGRPVYRDSAFESFERFVRDWLQEQDLHSLDYVFQPQYRFVEDRRGNIIVDYVGRIERMDGVEMYVADVTGVAALAVPTKNVVQRRAHYRRYYPDAGLVNCVGDLYRRDVDLFNYDFGA